MKTTSINERIAYLVLQLGIDEANFAKELGINKQTLRFIVLNRSKPGYETLMNIINGVPNLNVEWLMTGIGDIEKDKSKPMKVNYPYIEIKDSCEKCENYVEHINELRELIKLTKINTV